MTISSKVEKILANYQADNPGTRSKLSQILMHGKLGGTGRMIILPVDQGFEHGPARSFAINPEGYDPLYHHSLAIEAGLNAYAAPLGMLEVSAPHFPNQIPLILKINSANSLQGSKTVPDQAITASVKDALRLGCSAIGFTIYPASAASLSMIESITEIAQEAKSCGLAVVIWSYPRGGDLTKEGETAIDVIAYAAHIAALCGAHIIKVKLPTDHLEQNEAKKIYQNQKIPVQSLTDRVAHIRQCCFAGKRLVVFSGGSSKHEDDLYKEAVAIRDGGGNGSIIGRNSFQRPKKQALDILNNMIKIYHE